MELFSAVLPVCIANIPGEGLAQLAAGHISPFIVIGNGWALTTAASNGYDRLVVRLGASLLLDETAILMRLQDFNEAFATVVAIGDIAMARILVTSVPNARVTKAISVAARCGRLPFLQWLFMNFFDECWGGTEMSKAARFGHLDVLTWLQNNTVRRGQQHLLSFAARHLSTDILEWVIAKRREVPEVGDFIVAAEHGRLENIRIMAVHTHVPPCIPANSAARNGHIHVLRWLAANGGIYKDETMDQAAQNGHLDVLIWLRQNRSEGCSIHAITRAAMNGHISVVQWLVRHYPQGLSPSALCTAVSHGHINVAQWLYNEVDVHWVGNVVEAAVTHGSRRLVAWAMEEFPIQRTPAVMDLAAFNGNKELFFALHNANGQCTSDAIDFFAANGDLTPWCVGLVQIGRRDFPQTQWTWPRPAVT